MLKWIVTASALLAFTTAARADISADLKFCAGLSASKERLACYDAAARIEKHGERKAAALPVRPAPVANAMAYSPTPVLPKSPFNGAYIGATGGWDVATAPIYDLPNRSFVVPIPETVSGAKVGLLGGYNVTSDRMLIGFEGRWQHNFSVATTSSRYSTAAQPLPFVTYSPERQFTVSSTITDITRLSHPDQVDFSLRGGIIFGDLLVFGKVGVGAESTKIIYTKDARQNVQCISPIAHPFDQFGRSSVTGCAATANGTVTSSSQNSINPIAVFGGGIEYNYGDVFARIEAEMIAHFLGDYGTPGYTPAANFTIGYRF